jgi:hypothetical protein
MRMEVAPLRGQLGVVALDAIDRLHDPHLSGAPQPNGSRSRRQWTERRDGDDLSPALPPANASRPLTARPAPHFDRGRGRARYAAQLAETMLEFLLNQEGA